MSFGSSLRSNSLWITSAAFCVIFSCRVKSFERWLTKSLNFEIPAILFFGNTAMSNEPKKGSKAGEIPEIGRWHPWMHFLAYRRRHQKRCCCIWWHSIFSSTAHYPPPMWVVMSYLLFHPNFIQVNICIRVTASGMASDTRSGGGIHVHIWRW